MKDLTVGKPIKRILLFAIPILIGNITQLFYTLVDTRIVGEYLGTNALASISATSTLTDLLISFVNGITTGFSLVSATRFGAKNKKELRKSIGGTAILGVLISLLLIALCLIFIDPILRFLQVDEQLLENSKSYVTVIISGLVVTALYNIFAASLRAVGDSVTPLIFLIIAAIINVGLDVLFVKYLELGVSGAATATVMAQIVSVVLCFIYVLKKYPELFHNLSELVPDRYTVGRLLNNGLSMGFMSSFVCIGTVCIQTQINTFGESIIVGHTAARRILNIFFMPIFVVAAALATFCGQNKGAGRPDRIKEGIRDAVIVNWAINLLSMLVVFTLGETLVKYLVASENTLIIETAMRNMRFNILFFPIVVLVVEFRNAMQGFGDTRTPIISSLLELLVKVLIAIFLAPVIRYTAVVICEPVAWIIMVIPLAIKMFILSKRNTSE